MYYTYKRLVWCHTILLTDISQVFFFQNTRLLQTLKKIFLFKEFPLALTSIFFLNFELDIRRFCHSDQNNECSQVFEGKHELAIYP